MQEAAFELMETQLGLDARRIELYQSFGIIETKSTLLCKWPMTNSGNPTKAEDTSNRMGNARFKKKA